MTLARLSLTLSRHFSLSFIASGRSSGLHPVSSHRCWIYVRAGRPAFARPCMGVLRSTSLMSSSLLLQQCPACLVRLTGIVFVMGSRWPHKCSFVYLWIKSVNCGIGHSFIYHLCMNTFCAGFWMPTVFELSVTKYVKATLNEMNYIKNYLKRLRKRGGVIFVFRRSTLLILSEFKDLNRAVTVCGIT